MSQWIGLREKNTGKSPISLENLWFPDVFPNKTNPLNAIPSGKQTELLKIAIEIVDLPVKNGDFT
jgi:hypothetical protein